MLANGEALDGVAKGDGLAADELVPAKAFLAVPNTEVREVASAAGVEGAENGEEAVVVVVDPPNALVVFVLSFVVSEDSIVDPKAKGVLPEAKELNAPPELGGFEANAPNPPSVVGLDSEAVDPNAVPKVVGAEDAKALKPPEPAVVVDVALPKVVGVLAKALKPPLVVEVVDGAPRSGFPNAGCPNAGCPKADLPKAGFANPDWPNPEAAAGCEGAPNAEVVDVGGLGASKVELGLKLPKAPNPVAGLTSGPLPKPDD